MTTIDSDNPNRTVELEVLTTSSVSFTYTKSSDDSFLESPKIVVATAEYNGTVLKTLTVGDGITIDGNTLTVTFTGSDYTKYAGKTLCTIHTIVNEGHRDVIMPLKVIYSYG